MVVFFNDVHVITFCAVSCDADTAGKMGRRLSANDCELVKQPLRTVDL